MPDNFNSSNIRSVQVYENENLTAAVRSRAIKGDIFTLVAYLITESNDIDYLNKQLYKSKNKVLEILGWRKTSFKGENKDAGNTWLKDLKDKRSKAFDLSKIEPNPVLPESTLNEFIKIPHSLFMEDGIEYNTQVEFEICFDIQSERVCIPIRNRKGELIGIKGRATKIEDIENFKYLPIYSFHKSRELFNLHRALPHIQKKNEVILWEAEKSCLLSHQYGVKHTVSQMGSDITKVQAEIIKRISPNIKIIIGYDKGISPEEIKQMAKVFGDYNNLYAIYDTKDLLQDKQSPVDVNKEVFEQLYNECCFPVFPDK